MIHTAGPWGQRDKTKTLGKNGGGRMVVFVLWSDDREKKTVRDVFTKRKLYGETFVVKRRKTFLQQEGNQCSEPLSGWAFLGDLGADPHR